MWTRKLTRWGGAALALGGVLLFIASLINPALTDPNAVLSNLWTPVHILIWCASVLNVFGLIGLYLRQAEEAGRLGLIGFIMSFFGNAVSSAGPAVEAYALPAIAVMRETGPKTVDALLFNPAGPLRGLVPVLAASFVVTSVGYILTGIAIMRAGVLPRWGGLLLIIGPVTGFAFFAVPAAGYELTVIFAAVVGVAFAWLGYALWSDRGRMTGQPSPAE